MFGPYLGPVLTVFAFGAGIVLAGLVILVLGVACSALPELGLGRIMLNCPHCGAETPANDGDCRACRRSFRDESLIVRPVIDAPKLRT